MIRGGLLCEELDCLRLLGSGVAVADLAQANDYSLRTMYRRLKVGRRGPT